MSTLLLSPLTDAEVFERERFTALLMADRAADSIEAERYARERSQRGVPPPREYFLLQGNFWDLAETFITLAAAVKARQR